MSFDELGRPLRDITFCVVDLETTGASVQGGAMITEIGAVKVRGGELLGEFQTLVNPHAQIPPFIAVLTGITNSMVAAAPPIESALPAFLEFAQGTVLVAHNAPFDIGFLKHFATAQGRPWPGFEVVDTARLARRVITRDDAPNCKLSSLAIAFRSGTTPNHRALSDARATVDVLHGLMERLGGLGVHTLEELQTFTSRVSPAVRRKRHLAEHLPHSPGVYLFRDEQERVLYVGTSRDLRTRVRSYFTASESRSRMGEMVNLAASVTGIECATPLEAGVRELRLIAAHKPRYNRRSRHPEKMHWLKLTVEPWPRLSLVRKVAEDGADYLGPFASRRTAEKCLTALHEAFPIRQCSDRLAITPTRSPCVLAEMGRCLSPCDGSVSMDHYATLVATVRDNLLRARRRGGRGPHRPDGPAGGRRALRGGRRASRPALRVRAGRVPHPAARLPVLVRRAGGCPARGRPPMGGARRTPRTAGCRGRDPARRPRRRLGHRSCGSRPRPWLAARARPPQRVPRSPSRSCAGSSSPASGWCTSTASGPAPSAGPPGTSRCTTRWSLTHLAGALRRATVAGHGPPAVTVGTCDRADTLSP